MDEWRKKATVVAMAGALFAVLPGAGPARAEALVVGVCRLTVSTGTHALPPPASLETVNAGGSGPCWVVGDSGGPYTGTLATTVTGVFGCVAGAAVGTGTFVLARPGFPGDLTLTAAVTASGVLTVSGAELRFVGAGVFVPSTDAAGSCTSGPTPMSWTGKFVFEDPKV